MEKEQRKRTEMIPYLQDTMEETFQRTCREIQTVLDTNACRIWRGFHDVVCECLETAGDGFYMDTAEASAYYHADFLQDRFRKDLASLYEKARTHFVRRQNNELDQIRQEYAGYYYSLLFSMTGSQTGMIRGAAEGSSAETADGFQIICGDYMDKAVILYREET